MYQASFGSDNQVTFSSESEYYQALGYLAKSDGSTSLTWENNENQGAWGSEGRIHFYIQNPPIPGYFRLTTGVGNVIHRTNCNEFLSNLYNDHCFINGKTQDIQAIRNTVPAQFVNDFNIGLSL